MQNQHRRLYFETLFLKSWILGHFLPKFPQIFENARGYNSGMVGDMKKTLYIPIFTLVPGYAEPKSQICSFRDKKVMASDRFLTFLAIYNLYVKILLRYLTWWIVGAFRFFWPILVQCARIRVKLRPKMRFLDFTVIKWYLVTDSCTWSQLVTYSNTGHMLRRSNMVQSGTIWSHLVTSDTFISHIVTFCPYMNQVKSSPKLLGLITC